MFKDDGNQEDDNDAELDDGGDVVEDADCVEVDLDVIGLDDLNSSLMMLLLLMSMLFMHWGFSAHLPQEVSEANGRKFNGFPQDSRRSSAHFA